MSQSQVTLSEEEVRLLLACLESAVAQELVVDYQRLQANRYPGVKATALHQKVSRLARKAGVKIKGDGRERKGVKRRAAVGRASKAKGKKAVEEEEEDDDDDEEDGGDADPTTTTTTKKPRLDDDDDDMAGGGGAAATATTTTATVSAAA